VLTPGAAYYDNIRDFVSGADRIEISASLFGGGLAAGALSGLQFVVNGSGLASDFGNGATRFIYSSSNGQLFYDADGT
jgi:Ca2+-binding RTX toxin-like protein